MRVLFIECPNDLCGFGLKFTSPNKTFFYCKRDRVGINVPDADVKMDHYCKTCDGKMERYNMYESDNLCPICEKTCLEVAYQPYDATTEREKLLEKYKSRPPIPENEFLNPDLFPRTTQGGLNYEDQVFINSFNWNECARRMIEEGEDADRDALRRIRELEIKFGASFIENLLSRIEDWEKSPRLYMVQGCTKCGGPGTLLNRLCAYCDRRQEIETGESDTGDWYRKFIQGGLAKRMGQGSKR